MSEEIDVSKCQYYSKVDNCCHIFGNPLTATPCGYHKGCYYKQLQRLKQENEHLKEVNRLGCLKCEYKNTKTDLDKAEQKLERIKELCNKYKTCRIVLKGPIFQIIEGEEE